MTRREVQFLWAGLVVGFMLGAVAAFIIIAHIYGVPHLGERTDAVHAVR